MTEELIIGAVLLLFLMVGLIVIKSNVKFLGMILSIGIMILATTYFAYNSEKYNTGGSQLIPLVYGGITFVTFYVCSIAFMIYSKIRKAKN